MWFSSELNKVCVNLLVHNRGTVMILWYGVFKNSVVIYVSQYAKRDGIISL